MNANKDDVAMKDIGRRSSSDFNESMQSVHPTFSVSSQQRGPGLHSSQPAMSNSFLQSDYNGSTIHYGGENMFLTCTTSSLTSPVVRSSDGVPSSVFDSSFVPNSINSLPYNTPPKTHTNFSNYPRPGTHLSNDYPIFASPSYSSYPRSLPINSNQPVSKRHYLSTSPQVVPRFPNLHPGAPGSELSGYSGSPDFGGMRSPFSSHLLSSDRKMLEVPQSSLTSVSSVSDMEHKDLQNARKKRKACGHCAPCQRKENCGTCMNCINRAKGKQICIHRKCEVLKKKPGTASYASLSADAKQEKRKDPDNFLPSAAKRSKSTDNPSTDLPQGLIHPTLHPNFSEFGDVSRPIGQEISKNSLRNLVGSSLNPQTNETSTFFDSSIEVQQYRHISLPPNQALHSSPSSADEANFISQALQAIESNINSKPDESNAFHQQLLSPVQRQSSQESNFTWGAGSVAPIQLPGQPPPVAQPPGPGPGGVKPNSTVSGSTRELEKFSTNSSKDFSGAVQNASIRRQSHHEQGPHLSQLTSSQRVDDIKTTLSLNISNQSYQGVTKTNNQLVKEENENNLHSMYQPPAVPYSQLPGSQAISAEGPLGLYDRQNSLQSLESNPFSSASLMNVPLYGHSVQHGNSQYIGNASTNPRLSYNGNSVPQTNPSVYLNKPTAPSSDELKVQPGVPFQQSEQITNSNFSRPQYQQNIQYNQYGAETGQAMESYQSAYSGPRGGTLTAVAVNQSSGQQWRYSNQATVQHNPQKASNLLPVRSPSSTAVQHPSAIPHRRISNTSVDSFHNQRHMSAGSGNNQSPMMQASPGSGPSVISHSPFTPGNSVRSPMPGLIVGSPASQVQGLISSPMPPLPSPPLRNDMPNLPSQTDSSFQRSMQQYWTGNDQPGPSPRTLPAIHYRANVSHSIAPSDNYAQKPPVSVKPIPPHFLAEPGSSLNSLQSSQPYNRNVAPQTENEPQKRANVSYAAARLSRTDSFTNSETKGLHFDTNESPHETFTKMMSSVLCGKPPSGEPQKVTKASAVPDNHPQARTTASPNDVHSTISPGESGYDSMELSSILSDSLSQSSGKGMSTNSDIKAEKPKNLPAALMGNKNPQTMKLDNYQRDGAKVFPLSGNSSFRLLPIKAALSQVDNLKQTGSADVAEKLIDLPQDSSDLLFSTCDRVLCSLVEKKCGIKSTTDSALLKSRSTSLDSTFPSQTNEDNAKNISNLQSLLLRRFSCQGIGLAEGIIPSNTPSQISSTMSSTSACSFNKTASRGTVPQITQAADLALTSAPSSKPVAPVKLNITPPGLHPSTTFDTPPQTPHYAALADSVHRKFSDSTHCPPSHTINGPSHPAEFNPVSLTSDDLRGRSVHVKTANGTAVKKTVFPQCNCAREPSDEAPYYTHLGSAFDVGGIRKLFEKRLGFAGKALRIEKVSYTGREGKTAHGCPIAKWILRRSNVEEKAMVVYRQRPGHHCATSCVVIIIMLWEGMPRKVADFTYAKCTEIIPTNGIATERRCGTNEERTCACQGFDSESGGASFSFGCSWSMYYNGCKFARSNNPNKFKLNGSKDHSAETFLDEFLQTLATLISRLYKKAAPEAYENQTERENEGTECRLGTSKNGSRRPFSGVTCCMDFCAHAHKDQHNMDNGTTIVVTLTKPENRAVGVKPSDEQLHVLPLYRWDPTNEGGEKAGIAEKIKSGAVEILSGFRREIRLRDKPLGTCKERKRKKKEEAAFSSPDKKKRGRKPKRSISMENLSSRGAHMANSRDSSQLPCASGFDGRENYSWNNSQWNATALNQTLPSPTMNPLLSPPPRWPYRRHPSSQHVNPENLPSIGSIFSPGHVNAGLTPPVTPSHFPASPIPSFHFGRRTSSTSPAQDCLIQQSKYANLASTTLDRRSHCSTPLNQEVTPLPSLSGVASRTFQKDGAKVKTEPDANHYTFFPTNESEPQISLTDHSQSTSTKHVKDKEATYFLPQFASFPFTQPVKQEKVNCETFADSTESFLDHNIGGVAIAPGHGSILIECAKRELHATTSLLKPNRYNPSRISLVFYQHKNMNYRNHGSAEYYAKEVKRNQEKADRLQREKDDEMTKQQNFAQQSNPIIHPTNVISPSTIHVPRIAEASKYDQFCQPIPERPKSSIRCEHLPPNAPLYWPTSCSQNPNTPVFQPTRFLSNFPITTPISTVCPSYRLGVPPTAPHELGNVYLSQNRFECDPLNHPFNLAPHQNPRASNQYVSPPTGRSYHQLVNSQSAHSKPVSVHSHQNLFTPNSASFINLAYPEGYCVTSAPPSRHHRPSQTPIIPSSSH